jgi:hypothetical protein
VFRRGAVLGRDEISPRHPVQTGSALANGRASNPPTPKEPAVEVEPFAHIPAGEAVAAIAVRAESILRMAAVNVKPDPNGLPGMPAATKLVDGLAAFILLACVAGFLLGVGQWVLGSKTSNFSQSDSGKSKVLVSVLGAFGVGAVAAIINFFLNAGTALK